MRRLAEVAMLAFALVTAGAGPPAGGDRAPGTLVRRLRASGRADVSFVRSVMDPLSGRRRTVRGALALEPPDRVDVRFPAAGERIAIRADGGEWLQPALRQMLRLGPEQAAVARRWWAMLAGSQSANLSVRTLAADRYLVLAENAEGEPPDSAWVWLDRAGLPVRLDVHEGEAEPTVYRFSAWRFGRARGPSAFRITPPADFEVVRVP